MSVRGTLVLLFVCLLIPGLLFAQSSTGSISGTITDDSGAALPGVTVTATSVATGATRTAVTNETGYYEVALLPPADYNVDATLEGFQPVRRGNVTVNVGSSVTLDVTLRVGISDTVTVVGSAPLVETERTQISSVVNETAIENLPTNGRNFIDFVLTTPGVVKDVRQGDISFAGQRGTLNSLVIDGANNDNTFFGQALGRTGSGRAPYQFSQDAVQEFVVNTNAYSAEYGRAGGAVINVVTKSGTNDVDGSLFYFLRDKDLNANDYINVINNRAKSPYHFDQYGASAGGPIVPNRHFFFVNYDAQRNSIPNLVVLGGPAGGYPGDEATAAGLAKLNALAASSSRNQDQDVYLIKTDHEIGKGANHLTLRMNRQEFVGKNFESGGLTNALEHTGDSNVTTDTYAATLGSTFSSAIFNEARLQYAKDQEPGLANSAMPEAVIRQGGVTVLTIGRNFFSPRETTIKRYQIADTVTAVMRNHTVKAGFDYSRDEILNYFPGNFSGSYQFDSIADYQNGKPSRFLQAFAGPGTSGATTNPDIAETGLFLQDEWRMLPSLTLSLGLRYDLQSIAQPDVRNTDAQLLAAGIDTSVVPEDTNNLAPRLGFAWTPGADGRTVVRGGYGIFYGRTPAIMIGTAHSNNGINVQTITFTGNLIPQYPNIYPSLPTGVTLPKPTIFAFDPDFENPEVHQASIGVERGLTNDISIGLNYQHVQGNNLQRSIDYNVGGATTATTPISTGGNATYVRYTTRPLANFSRVILFQSSADSRYNGWTVDLNKRFANNWQARLAYTWSKVEDNRPDATAVVPGGSDDAKYIQDPLNIDGDWAPGDNDVRHRVVFSGVWDLDGYTQSFRGWKQWVLGGWSLSGIAAYQTGQPYSAIVSSDLNNDGNTRNDRAPGFARNSFRLPSTFSVDPRIAKSVPLGSAMRLQLIAEAFNVFNRSNVNAVRNTYYGLQNGQLVPQTNPATGFGSPSTSAGPR
ncbi:MAG TPA: TonB-dependent receptor, partial [Thermoanaerobaculia bacterium]|nr:TonB-dependent receptor [Thermoanaerobaculia bacterium]